MDFNFYKWVFGIAKWFNPITSAIIIGLWILLEYAIVRGSGAVIGYWDIIVTVFSGAVIWFIVYAIRSRVIKRSEKELRNGILQAIRNQNGRATLEIIALNLRGDPVFVKELLDRMLKTNILRVQEDGGRRYYVLT